MSVFSAGELQKRLPTLQQQLGTETTAFRLFDASDVSVDFFAGVCVLSFYRDATDEEERAAADALMTCAGVTGVYLKRRPREARRVANESPAEVAPVLPIAGSAIEHLYVRENGITFDIRPSNGLSVGLYLDARDARKWVRAHSRDLTVLNLFSYTCGFGIAALAGGASRAVNVDASRKVLDWGRENCELNQLAARVTDRDFISGDAFDWLNRFTKKQEQFDVVVLDPPGFATTKERRFSAARDYADLVTAASPVIRPGGTLLAMCNVEQLSDEHFEGQVTRGLGSRRSEIIQKFGASAIDYAQPPALKCLALRVK